MFTSRKITGLYKEFAVPLWIGILLLTVAAATVFLPWLVGKQELSRDESLHAVIAQEFTISAPVPTAHHVQQFSEGVIYQAAASALHKISGLSLVCSLRTVSFIMLLLTAALAGISAASRSRRSGIVAAAVMLSTLLVLDKANDAYPTTTNAFFLLSAQLAFFYYGIRKANWNMAWLSSAILITLAFFSGGFRMLIYFIFPMLFFRRPLSVKSKFRKPGFVIAVFLLSFVIVGYLLQFSINTGKPLLNEFLDSGLQSSGYWKDVLMFPLELPVRLLPWTLVLWFPFCVALQTIDQTPIYSRYLRTLTLSTFVLLWLLPNHDAREIIYMMGPLAIQMGIFYDTGTRRYGNRVRKLLVIGEFVILLALVALIGAILLPEEHIKNFFSISSSLAFRNSEVFRWEIFSAIACCSALGIIFYFGRRTAPLWMLMLILTIPPGLFYGIVIKTYQEQDKSKQQLANDVTNVLKNEKISELHTCDITGFYGGLFYTGIPVYQLNNVSELPEHAETVYLVSTTFPQTHDRKWSNMLPPNYTYQKEKIYLWKGVLKENNDLNFDH